MRDLNELGMNDGGCRPVDRPPPTPEQVQAFESHFDVKLPKAYLRFLQHSNGGYSLLDAYVPIGLEDEEFCGVDHFHFLNDDRESTSGLWWATLNRPRQLEPLGIPIVKAGGGDEVFLNFEYDPPMVQMYDHEADFEIYDVAETFEEFIDMLETDPDLNCDVEDA